MSRTEHARIGFSHPGVFSTHSGGVDGLGVIVDHSGQAEVGHFTDEVAVDEDVARRQVPVHVAHVREVAHPGGDAAQHTDQLDYRELPVMLLSGKKNQKKTNQKPTSSD